jgi:predicted transposase YbfD/YdcC
MKQPTQREIATGIVEKDGDYILCVKGNQGNLHKEIGDHFQFAARQLGKSKLDPANWSHAETLAKSHDGRADKKFIQTMKKIENVLSRMLTPFTDPYHSA